MNDELTLLGLVATRLEKTDLSYMVTGSVAMNFYGNPRMTRDIDIVLEISTENAAKIHQLFHLDFYIDQDMILEAIRHEGMFNAIHFKDIRNLLQGVRGLDYSHIENWIEKLGLRDIYSKAKNE